MKKNSTPQISTIQQTGNKWAWMFLAAVMLFVTLIRIRISGVPLERDEGEYAYMGQLILHGIPPYQMAYNMKFPGTYYMYSLIMALFGQSITAIHLGFMLVNLATILLMFLLVKRLIGNYAASVAAAVYAIMSLSSSVLGFAAHATQFVMLPAVAGLLFMVKAKQNGKAKDFFLSGLLLGFAPIMKQPGICFCLVGGFYLIIDFIINRKERTNKFLLKFALFILGGIIPFIILFSVILASGVFHRFWFWTIQYASSYPVEPQYILSFFKKGCIRVMRDFYPLWILATFAIVVPFFHPSLKIKTTTLFVILLAIFSFIGVSMGFHFTPHYFVFLLPSIAIQLSLLVDYLYRLSLKKKNLAILKWLSVAVFAVPLLLGMNNESDYLYRLNGAKISRKLYDLNPFPESIPIARYIKANSTKDDKILVFGSEPQIYFYADRYCATGYLYTYSLMEIQENSLKMQKEMISEIETAKPKFIVYVLIDVSWLRVDHSESFIFKWMAKYLVNEKYEVKGTVVLRHEGTDYYWNNDASKYLASLNKNRPPYYILVFEKQK